MAADLSPAGSSSYDSNLLHVGDGTWDNGRDTFLLPNLLGTNFATTRYNGMGNRFAGLPLYHNLILGHGVMAALVFILIVPAAIFSARYYHGNPRLALKLHIYLQILTVLLLTVVVVLGYFAVGPERSLSNPHHGIGIAIYVSVLFQFLWGALMHRLEKRRERAPSRLPLKIYLHQWLGRGIALLGFTQIALGLTLYGSPKVLFILYAVAGALLLFAYFALDYWNRTRGSRGGGEGYSDYTGSYLSGSSRSRTELSHRQERREGSEDGGHHWLRKAALGAGGIFAFKKWRDSRKERDVEKEYVREEVVRDDSRSRVLGRERPPAALSAVEESYVSERPPSRGPRRRPLSRSRLSRESWEDEKYEQTPKKQHTWRNRIFGAAAGAGALAGARKLFGGGKDDDVESVDSRRYRRPAGAHNHSYVSQTDVSRVVSGEAPLSPEDPRRRDHAVETNMTSVVSGPPMTPTRTGSRRRSRLERSSEDYMSYDSREYLSDPGEEDRPQHMAQGDGHTLRESIATFGALAGFREWNKRRKNRGEQQRIDRERRQERENADHFNRRNSGRYPRPQDGNKRRPSGTETLMTGMSETQDHDTRGSNPELSRHNFGSHTQLSSAPNTSMPPLPATAGALPHSTSRVNVANDAYNLPPPPPGPAPPPVTSTYPETGSLAMPQGAVQPDPTRLVQDNTNYNASSHYPPATSGAANTLAGAAIANQIAHDRDDSPSRYHRTRRSSRSNSTSRPPPPPAHGRSSSFSSTSQMLPNDDGQVQSPPISVKVDMHNDGKHVTLRRLPEEEAAAERAARRSERRQRRRRGSSVSGSEAQGSSRPPLSSENRHRNKHSRIRPAANQPIAPVPVPPQSTSTLTGPTQQQAYGGRPSSELNLPPTPQHTTPTYAPQPVPVAMPVANNNVNADGYGYSARPPPMNNNFAASTNTLSPPAANLNPRPPPPPQGGLAPSGQYSVGSPGDPGTGTGTDVSAFADNRRRRRAERARKLEAARSGGRGGERRVEFE